MVVAYSSPYGGLAVGLFAVLAISLAAGQTASPPETKTVCGWEYGRWTCRTATETRTDPLDAFRKGVDTVKSLTPAPHDGPDREAEFRQEAERQRAIALRERVGNLIVEKRCEEARDLALKAGDIDLASKVLSICQANVK